MLEKRNADTSTVENMYSLDCNETLYKITGGDMQDIRYYIASVL